MARAHIYHSYRLKEGKSEQDFLRVAEKFSNDTSLKTKGFISWTLLRDGEMWADILVYESMDDFKNATGSIHKNPLVHELGSFFDISSITEHRFTVAAST
jgi:quinol monooxygenase YgiN